jgi:hypothetical protein
MADPDRYEREQAFRADVARLVQTVRYHLPPGPMSDDTCPASDDTSPLSDDTGPLTASVQHLAGLLDAGASSRHLREAALAVVDAYDWPSPQASASDEGPVIDPAILAAVERLRAAIDDMDALNGDDEPDGLRPPAR